MLHELSNVSKGSASDRREDRWVRQVVLVMAGYALLIHPRRFKGTLRCRERVVHHRGAARVCFWTLGSM